MRTDDRANVNKRIRDVIWSWGRRLRSSSQPSSLQWLDRSLVNDHISDNPSGRLMTLSSRSRRSSYTTTKTPRRRDVGSKKCQKENRLTTCQAETSLQFSLWECFPAFYFRIFSFFCNFSSSILDPCTSTCGPWKVLWTAVTISYLNRFRSRLHCFNCEFYTY